MPQCVPDDTLGPCEKRFGFLSRFTAFRFPQLEPVSLAEQRRKVATIILRSTFSLPGPQYRNATCSSDILLPALWTARNYCWPRRRVVREVTLQIGRRVKPDQNIDVAGLGPLIAGEGAVASSVMPKRRARIALCVAQIEQFVPVIDPAVRSYHGQHEVPAAAELAFFAVATIPCDTPSAGIPKRGYLRADTWVFLFHPVGQFP